MQENHEHIPNKIAITRLRSILDQIFKGYLKDPFYIRTNNENCNCICNVKIAMEWGFKWRCFEFRLTRRVSLVEQELLTLPEHPSSPLVFSGVRLTRSLVLCVCFVDRCLSFCLFSFGHCVVCSSIYGFWLPLWYLQTLL